jgi:hypothetical protein
VVYIVRVARAVSVSVGNKLLVCAASASAAICLLPSVVTEPVLTFLNSRVGESFPWLKAAAAQGGKIVATATSAVTYNEKAVVLFRPERADEAMAGTRHSESLLRRVAGEYHMLLLQSGGHVVRVFE